MLLHHVMTARGIVSMLDNALRILRDNRVPPDHETSPLIAVARGDALKLQLELNGDRPATLPFWTSARMVANCLDVAAHALRAQCARLRASSAQAIALVESARDAASKLRADLDTGAPIECDVPTAPASPVGLGDAIRYAWWRAAAFRKALHSGDVEAIEDWREELIDCLQTAEHAQARKIYAEALNAERKRPNINRNQR
jgi:lysylphosphatidylglycerol synthetase-like protein (DUF2156 family)